MSTTTTDKMRANGAAVARIARRDRHGNASRFLTGPLAGLARLVHASVIAAVKRHIGRRACRRALMQLDDRLLRDIGLTRSEVDAIAHGLLTVSDTSRRGAESRVPSPRHRRKRR